MRSVSRGRSACDAIRLDYTRLVLVSLARDSDLPRVSQSRRHNTVLYPSYERQNDSSRTAIEIDEPSIPSLERARVSSTSSATNE